MKLIHNIIAVVILLTGVIGCQKEDKAPFEGKLFVGTELIEISNKSENHYFHVLANEIINVSTDADWIVLDTSVYEKGKQQVGFTVLSNTEEERTGVIYIRTSENLSKEILVVQESGLVPVFYVSVDGTGDGKSWSSPTDINTAIEKATTNSTIYLQEGVYRPTKTIRNGDATEESDKTFEISKNISLIGGFSKDAMVGATPNPTIYKTILDGNLSSGKQAFHTVTITAPLDRESKVHLEGLTITGGNATDRSVNITINNIRYSRGQGGGILAANAIIELNNVEIIGNKATSDKGTAGYAAGIYAFGGAELTLRNVKVNQNVNANNNGGGVWIADATMIAFDSEFNNNSARGTAGGIHGFPNATIYLYNSKVLENSNTSYGAGVYMRDNSTVYIVNTLISGNTSTSANGGGGVMLYDASHAHIISSTITNNAIAGPGGGVYRRSKANNLTIVNTIISGNTQISSSTDVDAYTDNAGIAPVIKNSILSSSVYDNTSNVIPDISFSPITMFDSNYVPVGTSNPALTYGLNGTELSSLGNSYNPSLDRVIADDIAGNNRVNKIMGYKIK